MRAALDVKTKTTYQLESNTDGTDTTLKLVYRVNQNDAGGNDSYAEGKTMALVLEPSANAELLSSSAQPGTYRLIFDVKTPDGMTVLSVPYYIIVKAAQ